MKGKTFAQLRKKHCRFPIEDTPEFLFCGAERVEGKPYCENCCRVAYRKPEKAKRDGDERQLSDIPAAA